MRTFLFIFLALCLVGIAGCSASTTESAFTDADKSASWTVGSSPTDTWNQNCGSYGFSQITATTPSGTTFASLYTVTPATPLALRSTNFANLTAQMRATYPASPASVDPALASIAQIDALQRDYYPYW